MLNIKDDGSPFIIFEIVIFEAFLFFFTISGSRM